MDGRVVKWWCSDLSSHQSPGTCSCFSRHPAVLWSCGATWQNLRRVTPTTNKIILRCAQQLNNWCYISNLWRSYSPVLAKVPSYSGVSAVIPSYPHLVSNDTTMSSPDPVGGVTHSCYHSATLASGPSHTVPHAPQYYTQSSWRKEELNTQHGRLHLLRGKLLNSDQLFWVLVYTLVWMIVSIQSVCLHHFWLIPYIRSICIWWLEQTQNFNHWDF